MSNYHDQNSEVSIGGQGVDDQDAPNPLSMLLGSSFSNTSQEFGMRPSLMDEIRDSYPTENVRMSLS